MVKRRKLPPDTRLDWRDPDMPVLRYGNFNGEFGTKEVAPQYIQNYYRAKLDQIGWKMPDYKDDPSYWWSRKNNLK